MNDATARTAPGDDADQDIQRALESASAGLLYPSESDEPFRLYMNVRQEDILKQALADAKGPVKETTIADFFAELVSGENGSRFEQLRRVVETRLIAPRVLRVGEVEVDIYIIGRTPSGTWLGLHTMSVET